jgi:hypothetical protein
LTRQRKTPIDVEGLMRAVEVANSEMGDASFDAGSVIGGCIDARWQRRKCALIEFCHG